MGYTTPGSGGEHGQFFGLASTNLIVHTLGVHVGVVRRVRVCAFEAPSPRGEREFDAYSPRGEREYALDSPRGERDRTSTAARWRCWKRDRREGSLLHGTRNGLLRRDMDTNAMRMLSEITQASLAIGDE